MADDAPAARTHSSDHPDLPLSAPALPKPPPWLAAKDVTLRFTRILPGNPEKGLVPAYHFRIVAQGYDVGHINLRVGDNEHVRICVGHVGYEITPQYRGNRYAFLACQALAPFARTIASELIVTCDPDNGASQRTIELLGATFIDEVPVPPHDPHYASGSRAKKRFLWLP